MICNSDGALFNFRGPLIRNLISTGNSVIVVCPAGPYKARLIAWGVEYREIELTSHSINPIGELKILFAIIRVIHSETPDVVHSFTHKPAVYGSLAAWICGCHSVFITITGLGAAFIREDARSRLVRTVLQIQYFLVSKMVSAVFFQNPDDLEFFVSKQLVARKLAILTNGSGIELGAYPLPTAEDIYSARCQLAREIGLEVASSLVVLLPARGLVEKGIIEFYNAARMINSQTSGYIFLHIGEADINTLGGMSSKELFELAIKSGVRYLGHKSDVRPYLYAADIVALPSYREGVPRALIESLAAGKCIVTTDAPGCRETVNHCWNGYLCQPRNFNSLAKTIMLVDVEFMKHCVARARDLCERKFDVNILIANTVQAYRAALLRKKNAPSHLV